MDPILKKHKKQGFTLVELIIATTVLMMVVAGSLTLFIAFRNSWTITTLARNTSSEASIALTRIVYGVGTNSGLRAAESDTVSVTYPASGWRIDYNTNRFLAYNPTAERILDEQGNVLCTNIVTSQATYLTNGCEISISVADSGGGRGSTNVMSSYVQFRN